MLRDDLHSSFEFGLVSGAGKGIFASQAEAGFRLRKWMRKTSEVLEKGGTP
jgi:hypothetical protein